MLITGSTEVFFSKVFSSGQDWLAPEWKTHLVEFFEDLLH